MSRFFNPDNPIMEFIAKIFDLILLNLLFIFSCVPIITIGASLLESFMPYTPCP